MTEATNHHKLPVLLALLVVAHFSPATADDVKSPTSFPITTLINGKWAQTPLYLEVAEYIADENPSLFWDFIETVTRLETPLNKYETESMQYNVAMNAAKEHLSVLDVPLLKLVVSMHSLTPRIQTHFQIAGAVLSQGDCKATAFVQIGSEVACTVAELRSKLKRQRKDEPAATLDATIESYSFDHIYPGSENHTRTAVLYGDIGSKDFIDLHNILAQQARDGNVRYLLRHYVARPFTRPVRLSGYGVELYLKSTEYKSQDDDGRKPADGEADRPGGEENSVQQDTEVQGFDFKILKAHYPTLTHSLDQLRQHLLKGSEEIPLLKAWQFQDLGLQATAAIAEIEGEEALQILQFTAQNFPMQAHALLGQRVTDALRAEVKHNTDAIGRSLNIVPPDGALFVNGLFFDADTMELGSLVDTLGVEMRVLQSLYASNVRGQLAASMLALDLGSAADRHDFAIDIRDTAILWINNIEKDPQYRRWPSSVMDLLRPTFPGMLRNIRKNVFNLVLVVDPLRVEERNIIKLAESFLIHQAPVRLGLLFAAHDGTKKGDNNDEDEDDVDYRALLCAFNYVTQKKDPRGALSFLTDIYAAVDSKERVRHSHIRSQLKKTFTSLSGARVDEILAKDSEYDYGQQLSAEFIERLGFSGTPQALLNGAPMQQSLLTSDGDFEEAIFTEVMQQTGTLQKAVYRGDLTDSEDVLDYLMNQPYVMPRLNQRILNSDSMHFLDLTGTAHKDLANVRALAQLSNRDMTATLVSNLKYFHSRNAVEYIGGAPLHFLTLWVIADLETADSREMLRHALEYMKTGSSVRVAFIPNSEGKGIGKPGNLNRLIWAVMQTLPGQEATAIALQLLQNPSDLSVVDPLAIADIHPASTELHVKMLRVYVQRVLGAKPSENLIVANGRLFGPLQRGERFSTDDFGLLDRFNAMQCGEKVRQVLRRHYAANESGDSEADEESINSDTLLKLYAALVPRQSKSRFKMPDDIREEHTVIKLAPRQPDLPHFEIQAVVDPASRSAQKLTPLLLLLRNILNCRVRVYLTPVTQHSDMPVKNFYRYVIEQEVQFQPNGALADGPIAKFTGVPLNPLYTQNLQVPDNWLVEAVRAVYDLDNIRLSEIGGPVHSEFELEYLLLEGHCFDAGSNGAPPRGLQITLGSSASPAAPLVDTIVMANLGYFQLKANPGVWQLRLRTGKSSEMYDITHADGPNTINGDSGIGHTDAASPEPTTVTVVISSLRSHVIKMRVQKKAAFQNVDLLGDDSEGSDQKGAAGIWNTIASSFGGSSGGAGSGDDAADPINIFSVASGHLYERLLRIMMVSLLKHTQTPVKFWFLKNYLSPQFTDFLPHMAREYGFQYELVQYKWPRWLHQQTEKQRTIWGYKILFLDVLFPLNVRKIIFVDADAIVRADLKELYDMDLGGAPYAYTPFCDSRKEMEGFRFWKQGYWRSHLMGRRYHISALYVVDLRRFRKIAAGDRLRGQYQALSQDPNSLSNLDQDLPNNMIHQVAIKSLPDDWLWCQTWCNDASLKSAKVIDLCNNPQTKEAKLTAAQRIVPEWRDYDMEIKGLLAKIEEHENSETTPTATVDNSRDVETDADDDNNNNSNNDNDLNAHHGKHSEL